MLDLKSLNFAKEARAPLECSYIWELMDGGSDRCSKCQAIVTYFDDKALITCFDDKALIMYPSKTHSAVIPTEKECEHKWKSYVGLCETYDYCEVCDVKR